MKGFARDLLLSSVLLVIFLATTLACIDQAYRVQRQRVLQPEKPLMSVVTVTRVMTAQEHDRD